MKNNPTLRTFFIVILPALVLAGCAASSKLQSTLGNKYKYSTSMTSPEKSKEMVYRDEQLMIQFRMEDKGIRFQAQNISPDTMRIDWSKASVGVHGTFSPVRTVSTFYDTTRQQPAVQVLASLGIVRDAILPRGNSYFDGAQWRVDDLLPTTDANTHGMKNNIMGLVGSTIEIQLPVECGSEVRPYVFSLSIDSVCQVSWSDYRPASWVPPSPPVKKLRPTAQDNFTSVILGASFLGFLRYMMTVKKIPVVE